MGKKGIPQKIVVGAALFLILGGVILTAQDLFFRGYQIGVVFVVLGAILQIIMGNLDPGANWKVAVRTFLIGLGIFLLIIWVSISIIPWLFRYL